MTLHADANPAPGVVPAHPLDPATTTEYKAGKDILAAAGLLSESVRFAYFGLEEPPKQGVLAGQDGERRLRAFLIDLATGTSFNIVVPFARSIVVSARRLDPLSDGQMPILEANIVTMDTVCKADPEWRACLAKRGITDMDTVRTAPITAGAMPEADEHGAPRRMILVLAFVQAKENNMVGRTRSTGWYATSTW